jgi:GAF domain-containing protein
VTPIVRAHHEKWDGSGYPYGLKGEEIPIGARILAAVDCLDALASDRQYRKAFPLDEAMAKVAAEAGINFDPQVVAILRRRYVEMERLANQQIFAVAPKLSTDLKIRKGSAPDAGLAEDGPDDCGHSTSASGVGTAKRPIASQLTSHRPNSHYLSSHHEELELIVLCREMHTLLTAQDILSLVFGRLSRLVSHDAFAAYILRDEFLVPELTMGDNSEMFLTLRIPPGQGLCGWVAENNMPILNGNPSVEVGYSNDPRLQRELKSALAVPLEAERGVIGVLALYRAPAGAFTKTELNIVQTVVSRIGLALEQARRGKAATAAV